MELVLDANILFAIMIRSSTTAQLAFEETLNLIAPEFIIEEFLNHEEEILGKLKRTQEEFVQMMHLLKDIITIIPSEEYSWYINSALAITPDEKDTMYFALALQRGCAIWSNDRKLKEQDQVKVYNTTELVDQLEW